MFIIILFCVFAYLLGSFPTAVYYAKVFHGIDIREHGSGNAGATNSMRVMGKKAGAIVLIIDVLKGFLVVYLFNLYHHNLEASFLIGVCAVLGHILSIFSGFKGGKGIATSLGVILAINPLGALISLVAFISTVFVSKFVSLGSIIGAFTFAIFLTITHSGSILVPCMAYALLALLMYTHRANIKKIINGTENKFPPPKS